jgi:predicted GH43/DUF377 family glycosyl hydrolase
VKKGDIVSFLSAGLPETIACVYALNKIGAAANTIDPRLDVKTIKKMIMDSGSKILFVIDIAYPKVEVMRKEINQDLIVVQSAATSLPLFKKIAMKLAVRTDIPKDEKIINFRHYHTIKESKNGEGPHPIKTPQGWLHLAHGVRGCASGLRYVLYMYMTSLEDPTKVIAEPAGFFMAPEGWEYIGDVMNVLFTNGWIVDEDGKVFIYYASSDTRMHVATSTVDRLVDYCLHTEPDGLTTGETVKRLNRLIDRNL